MSTSVESPNSVPAGSTNWLISVDDHVVEPPNVWVDRLPQKYQTPLRDMTKREQPGFLGTSGSRPRSACQPDLFPFASGRGALPSSRSGTWTPPATKRRPASRP